MKVSKMLLATGVVLSAGVFLSACGKSSSSTTTYSYVYASDPDSLNYLTTNRATTSDVITNLVYGLMENDEYGNLTHINFVRMLSGSMLMEKKLQV